MAEEKKIISNDLADVHYLPSSRSLVSEVAPRTPVERITMQMGKIAIWGDDNLFPQRVNKDVRKTTELASGLRWMANTLISGGLVYGTLEYDDDGKEKLKPVRDPDIEKWLRKTNIRRYLRESAYEFYKFWNAFARLRLSRDGKMINEICAMESMFTRLGLQDDTTGAIKQAFVNANWDQSISADDPLTLTYPLIDPYYDAVEITRASKDREFIYPICGVDSGNIYYQVAPWNSVRESGWLEVAQLIPSFKKNLLKNQYTIKYHFQLTSNYWAWRFPKWDTMTEKERINAKIAVLKELDDFLKGEENAGKNIMSIADSDPVTKKIYPGLEILAIDDKIKTGTYIEDSQEAAWHIFDGLGIPESIKRSPSKTVGGGSGSNTRVAYNIYITGSKPEQDLMLEPIDFCFEYNGFSKKYENKGGLVTWFRNYWVAKLDEGKETQQEA